MRITPLASGSQGNATLVETGGPREPALLIDAGLRCDELEARLSAVGRRPDRIDAVLVTHRHGDHRVGVRDFALRHRVRVWCTRRTAKSLGTELRRRTSFLAFGGLQIVAGCTVLSFPVSHDAPETVGLVIGRKSARYGHVTDLGSWDETVVKALTGCGALLLEFNHDLPMLENGDDPLPLKQRITSDVGHLSNADAGALLARLGHSGLRRVWLAHLSKRNNTEALALAAAADALRGWPDVEVEIAAQEQPSAAFDLVGSAAEVES